MLTQPGSMVRSAATLGGGLFHTRTTGGVSWSVGADGVATLTRGRLGGAQYTVRTGLAPVRAPWWRGDVELSRTTLGESALEFEGNRAARLRQLLQRDISSVRLAWQTFVEVGRTPRPALDRYPPFTAEGHAVGTGIDISRGAWSLGLTGQRAFSDDWPLVEASGGALRREARYYTYDDAAAVLTYTTARLSLGASTSWRVPRKDTRGSSRGAAVTATVPLSRDVAFVVQAGEQLADLVRGLPRTRFSTLAVRWHPWAGGAFRRSTRALADAGRGTLAGTAGAVTLIPDVRGDEVLLVRREGQGTVTLSIAAPREAIVEVACSATDWAPVRLTVHDGRQWVHTITLPSGAHKVAVRVNGDTWRAPRGLTAVDDDFGGKAGVVVIP